MRTSTLIIVFIVLLSTLVYFLFAHIDFIDDILCTESQSLSKKIQVDIKKSMTREQVYKMLKKEKINYHVDKNHDIEITGYCITIKFNEQNIVYSID